jgi:hypothetical protein
VSLSEPERRILVHLDGKHDREALRRLLAGSAADHESAEGPHLERRSAGDPAGRDTAQVSVDEVLSRLARHALLVG